MMLRRVAPLLISIFLGQAAFAQSEAAWRVAPRIVVIASSANDPRFELVDTALAYWNKVLEEIGSGFRLGRPERIIGSLPEAALQERSGQVLQRVASAANIPAALENLPGDLRILLGDSSFVSFVGPFDAPHTRVVGIRSTNVPPLSLPNVAVNVIAHEIGHAIGLGHNSDLTALMCGRPASCRPDMYQSTEPKMFPLLDSERRQLLEMYPIDWRPGRRPPRG